MTLSIPDYGTPAAQGPATGHDEMPRWVLEMELDHGVFLPMPLPREHDLNRCGRCRELPTVDNPATTYEGQDPDLENGPSPRDLPYTLCERCETELFETEVY
jgi:hypothetical protein